MTRAPSRGSGAFTLLELMVVTAIAGMVVAVIAACLVGGIRVWDRAQTFNVVELESMIGLRIIEKDVANSFPFFGVRFEGGVDTMSFPQILRVRAEDGPADSSVILEERVGTVRYWFDEKSGRVLRRTWPFADPEPLTGGDEAVLSGVRGVAIRYYGEESETGEGSWREAWTEPSNQPSRVSVALTFLSDGKPVVVDRIMLRPARILKKKEAK